MQEVVDCVERLIKKANRLYKKNFPMPKIHYDLKGGNAGEANTRKWEIRLNAYMLENNLEDYLKDTIPHEVAHLVADIVFNYPKAHGPEWAFILARFGTIPRRCHSYAQEPKKRKIDIRSDLQL